MQCDTTGSTWTLNISIVCIINGLWTETVHTCLHSNIKSDCVSSFLCIQAMNVMLASWHTVQPTSLSLCLAYMWQGHNRVLDNRPLIEWLAGSGIHPWSSVTLQPRVPYGSWWVSGCTLLWRRGKGARWHVGNLGEVTEVKMTEITVNIEPFEFCNLKWISNNHYIVYKLLSMHFLVLLILCIFCGCVKTHSSWDFSPCHCQLTVSHSKTSLRSQALCLKTPTMTFWSVDSSSLRKVKGLLWNQMKWLYGTPSMWYQTGLSS